MYSDSGYESLSEEEWQVCDNSCDNSREACLQAEVENIKDLYEAFKDIASAERDLEWTFIFGEGYKICDDFLEGRNCVQCFVVRMRGMNLHIDLYSRKRYFPETIAAFLTQCEREGEE